jgi:hypothetical protein
MTGPAAPHGTTRTLPPPSANGSAPSPPPAPQRPRRALGGARLSPDRQPSARQASTAAGGRVPRRRCRAARTHRRAEHAGRAGQPGRAAGRRIQQHSHKLTAGARKVPVGWFRYMSKHTAILTMAGRDDLVVLVIPPGQPGSRSGSALSRQRPAATPARRRPSWRPPASQPAAPPEMTARMWPAIRHDDQAHAQTTGISAGPPGPHRPLPRKQARRPASKGTSTRNPDGRHHGQPES